MQDQDFTKAKAILNSSGRFLVLDVLQPFRCSPERFAEFDADRHDVVVFVGAKATGFDPLVDVPFSISLVKVMVDRTTGQAFALQKLHQLERPHRKISAEAYDEHGVDESTLAGAHFDEGAIEKFFNGEMPCSFVVAYDAEFTRTLLEGRFPFLEQLSWACGLHDVSWRARGIKTTSLELIAMRAGFTYTPGDGMVDVMAFVRAIGTRLNDYRPGYVDLCTSVRKAGCHIWAMGSPWASSGLLRSRGYSFREDNPAAGQKNKCWVSPILLGQSAFEQERDWLHQRVYGLRAVTLGVQNSSSATRYSLARQTTDRLEYVTLERRG